METFNTSQNSLAEKIFLKFSNVNSNEVKMLVLLYVAIGFWDLGLSLSFQNSFFVIVNIILPKALGLIFPSLQTNLFFSILQSCWDLILVTVTPIGIKSLKATSFNSYFDELFYICIELLQNHSQSITYFLHFLLK